MRAWMSLAALLSVGPSGAPAAEAPGPRPAPATRPDMKRALEDLKKARPRLPLPPLTAGEGEKLGGRPVVYNARMRQLYLPAELRSTDFPRGPDPNMKLDGTFKTMLFWIVSRGNDCHY